MSDLLTPFDVDAHVNDRLADPEFAREYVKAQDEEIAKLAAALDALAVEFDQHADWHKCACTHPCDDWFVYPNTCAGRYRSNFQAFAKKARDARSPSKAEGNSDA